MPELPQETRARLEWVARQEATGIMGQRLRHPVGPTDLAALLAYADALAAERDALEAKNGDLQRGYLQAEACYRGAVTTMDEGRRAKERAEAERDGLQAQANELAEHRHALLERLEQLQDERDALRERVGALAQALRLLLDATDGPPWVLPSGEYLSAKRCAEAALTPAVGADGGDEQC